MRLNTSSWATKLFYLFLLTDLGFIALHILVFMTGWLEGYPIPNAYLYSVEADRGFAEFFQYMKEYWCVLLLGLIAIKRRSFCYVSWMGVFFYLLIDDALMIHEKLGAYLSSVMGFPSIWRLRSVDFGELLVSGTVGLFLVVCISIAYRRGDSEFRRTSKSLLLFLVVLSGFGILLDLVHVISPIEFNQLLALLEDGGEMIVISAIAAFIFKLSEKIQFHLSESQTKSSAAC
ncbi:MAG: hypothetical protein MUC48_04430, partial [Leptolyngbya sp. Prado105]|nr:hypothetical protein [Leptolyngbya sp. Prado105]